jgi:hypothetical protein
MEDPEAIPLPRKLVFILAAEPDPEAVIRSLFAVRDIECRSFPTLACLRLAARRHVPSAVVIFSPVWEEVALKSLRALRGALPGVRIVCLSRTLDVVAAYHTQLAGAEFASDFPFEGITRLVNTITESSVGRAC